MKSKFIGYDAIMKSKFIGYDDDGTGTDEGGTNQKTYTEAEFNTHMANMRRKHEVELKKNQQELALQLEQQKKTKGLSEEERTSLQKRIDDLEAQYLTESQKAERKAAEQHTQFSTQLESVTGERDLWKTRFEKKAASSDIAHAANAHKAINARQISALLDPLITFKEVIVDGEPTGNFVPSVKFPDTDAKTKEPIVMEYTIDEAIKRMKELDEYSNLFEDTMRGGLGGSKNTGNGKKIDPAKLARENPAEYRRLRKENPQSLYGSMSGG